MGQILLEGINKDDIIDDLLRKRPKGPAHCPVTYRKERIFNYDNSSYEECWLPNSEYYGYSMADIFSLGIHDAPSVEKYILHRWHEGKSRYLLGKRKASVTKKKKRLWSRIQSAVEYYKREGGVGIYALTPKAYYEPISHIWSISKEEAQRIAETFFPESHSSLSYEVRLIELCSIEKLPDYNKRDQERLAEKLNTYQKTLDDTAKRIIMVKAHMETLNIFTQHQINSEIHKS
jgi:hypothetical protein